MNEVFVVNALVIEIIELEILFFSYLIQLAKSIPSPPKVVENYGVFHFSRIPPENCICRYIHIYLKTICTY